MAGPPPLDGNRREDTAAAAAAAIAVIWAAAEAAVLAALTAAIRRSLALGAVTHAAIGRLRAQLAAILVAAERRTRDLTDRVGVTWDMPIPGPEGHGLSIQALIEEVSVRVYRETPDLYMTVIRDAIEATRGGLPGSSLSVSRVQAAQRALDRFAEHGITGFTDRAGRNWDLLSYVEMATRTAVSNAYDNLHNAALIRAGIDLVTVYTRSAEGSCPHCLPWLGRRLSLTGQTPGFPTLAEARATGFRHPNCRCDWYSDLDGEAREVTGAVPLADSAKMYAASQRQRGYERRIRELGRLEAMAMTPAERARYRRELARLIRLADQHARDHGLHVTRVAHERRRHPTNAH